MILSRVWAMPNKNTFDIKPIRNIIDKYNHGLSIDPYSPRQVTECYTKLGKTVDMQTTQSSFWSNMKVEISRITKNDGGICISCGWNSGGIGKKYGFEIEEILIVPHGGWHNDTIITVDKRHYE